MEFGLDRCALLVLKHGVKVRCEGILFRDGQVMDEVDENGCKYFGLLMMVEARWRRVASWRPSSGIVLFP